MITKHGPYTSPFPAALGADFSADRVHRYLLWRVWDAATPPLGFLMLNPSTADETRDDPTTVRNMARARMLGYGGVVQANLYSFRTASPKVLRAERYPGYLGDYVPNVMAVARMTDACADVVVAWGAHAYPEHAAAAVRYLRALPAPPRLLHLGRIKSGMPRHPLMVGYDVPLQEWA